MLKFMDIGSVRAELFHADGRTYRRTDEGTLRNKESRLAILRTHIKINLYWFSSVYVEGFGN